MFKNVDWSALYWAFVFYLPCILIVVFLTIHLFDELERHKFKKALRKTKEQFEAHSYGKDYWDAPRKGYIHRIEELPKNGFYDLPESWDTAEGNKIVRPIPKPYTKIMKIQMVRRYADGKVFYYNPDKIDIEMHQAGTIQFHCYDGDKFIGTLDQFLENAETPKFSKLSIPDN